MKKLPEKIDGGNLLEHDNKHLFHNHLSEILILPPCTRIAKSTPIGIV